MNRTFVLACSMLISLSSFANKGADYSPPAHAPASHDNLDWAKGWYIGAGVNRDAAFTMQNGGVESLPFFTADEIELKNSNVGFDVYLGREISKYWSAEFGYTYIGNIGLNGETDEVLVQSATIKQWDLHLVGVGRLPVGEYFNFMLKGGAAWYYNSEKFHDLPLDAISHNNYRGFALTYGAGMEIPWDQFVIRGEYTVISPASNVQDDFYVTDIIAMSLIYKFM